MDKNTTERLKKLDKLSFNSLDSLGIDWRNIVNNDSTLQKEYSQFLQLKNNYILVNL